MSVANCCDVTDNNVGMILVIRRVGENIVMARVRRATLIRLIHRFEPVGISDKLVSICNQVGSKS